MLVELPQPPLPEEVEIYLKSFFEENIAAFIDREVANKVFENAMEGLRRAFRYGRVNKEHEIKQNTPKNQADEEIVNLAFRLLLKTSEYTDSTPIKDQLLRKMLRTMVGLDKSNVSVDPLQGVQCTCVAGAGSECPMHGSRCTCKKKGHIGRRVDPDCPLHGKGSIR